MAIPAGVILIHVGTNASIPTGWSRETTLDDKFPKAWGATVAPDETGGSNTHTHTGSHTHTSSGHTHSVSLNSNGDGGGCDNEAGSSASKPHGHDAISLNGTSGGDLQSTTVTWSSVNQEPPYYKVIFIKPTGVVAPLFAGVCAHYYGDSAPPSWNFCNGSNSTPDLRNKYLKGAETDADASETGGDSTHTHTITHGHTANSHTHSGNSNYQNSGGKKNGSDSTKCPNHYHIISLNASTDTVADYTKTDAGGETVEPAYKKLGVIKATVGVARKGIVGLWLGSVGSIPNGWVLCDGDNGTYDLRDKFVKIGAALSNNNETGGANTHSHTAISHTHTPTGTHTHTGSSGNPSGQNAGGGSGVENASYPHTHSLNVATGTAVYSSDNCSADTVNNEPVYRTVAYIQLDKLTYGGSHLLNFL